LRGRDFERAIIGDVDEGEQIRTRSPVTRASAGARRGASRPQHRRDLGRLALEQ
jgi:hypothetical protein